MAYEHMTTEALSALWADIVQRMDDEVAGLYDFKGSVATYAALPANAEAGDVYNVQAAYQGHPAGTNWAWTGSAWDALGGAMSDATSSASGLMSAADKAKLDDVEAGANAYSLPDMTESVKGGAKLGDGLRVVDGALASNIVYGYEEVGGIDMPTVTIYY